MTINYFISNYVKQPTNFIYIANTVVKPIDLDDDSNLYKAMPSYLNGNDKYGKYADSIQ